MLPKEKYNQIITFIEDCVESNEFEEAADVVKAVEKFTSLSNRELNIIFKFLLDKSVLEYIKERYMNKAYKVLIKNETFDCSSAIEIAGYSDQSTFIKAFKNIFNTTPYDAFYGYKNHDINLNLYLVDWDQLNTISNYIECNAYDINCFKEENKDYYREDRETWHSELMEMDSLYGIEKEKFELIKKLELCRRIHGFNDYQCDCLYGMVKDVGCDLSEACEILEEYTECLYGDEEPLEYEMHFIKWAYEILKTRPQISFYDLYCFFDLLVRQDISLDEIEYEDLEVFLDGREEFLMYWYEKEDAKQAWRELQKQGIDISFEDFYEFMDTENIPVEEAQAIIFDRVEEEEIMNSPKFYDSLIEETKIPFSEYVIEDYFSNRKE